MNTKQKLAILGISALSLMMVTSVALTVAWYDGSSYLALNDINIRLLDKELSISIDNSEFKNFLDNEEMHDAGKFRAISSEFSELWTNEKGEQPVFKTGYGASSKNILNEPEDVADATDGYFSQEFYIKCNSSVLITLDKDTTTFNPDESDNLEMVESLRERFPQLTDEEILQNLNDVVKSLRISLLVLNDEDDTSNTFPDYAYYIIDPYKDKTTYYAGILDTDKDGFFDYSHERKEVLYGQTRCNVEGKTVEECLVYDEPAEESIILDRSEVTCFNSGTKQGTKRINFPESYANGLEFVEEPSIAMEDVESEVLIPLRAETSKRIVLSFYQEGWDLENTDFVKYSHFYINVLFKIAKAVL